MNGARELSYFRRQWVFFISINLGWAEMDGDIGAVSFCFGLCVFCFWAFGTQRVEVE